MTRNDLEYLKKWTIFFISSDSLESSDFFSENLSANQLSYHHSSYTWFVRLDLLFFLNFLSLSLGLVWFILFSIWSSNMHKSLQSLFINFVQNINLFLLIDLYLYSSFAKKIHYISFLLHFRVYNKYITVFIPCSNNWLNSCTLPV